ncbi:MAG: AIR synthase-related protein, partial [Actinomycetota bacterium]|nr:AIR synthase-related protein [Actinomycetota bacterium]
ALASAHDVSEGGLLVAVAEACLAGAVGARLELGQDDEAGLFGEGRGGFVVSGGEDALRALGERTEVRLLGRVGGDALAFDGLALKLGALRGASAALGALFP